MKSSFEELLRDLQIISKELFLSSWNLVSTTNLNTAKFYTLALSYSMWLSYLHNTVKIQTFLWFSPWRNLWLRYFAGYPFETSRKKASTIFHNTAFYNLGHVINYIYYIKNY